MGIHRLTSVTSDGKRWSEPASGVVFVSVTGEVVHVDRGTIGETGRPVDTGRVWTGAPGEDDDPSEPEGCPECDAVGTHLVGCDLAL